MRISGPSSATAAFQAAYFPGSPAAASLPAGAPFTTGSRASGLAAVSEVEYWDINGDSPVHLTLTWDAASNLATLTGGSPSRLAVAGWNPVSGRWESLGTPTVTGTLSGSGTASVAGVIPSQYAAFTFAASTQTEIRVQPKVYLSGPWVAATGLMRDDLRGNNLLPTTQPYSTTLAPQYVHVNGGGTETVSAAVLGVTGPNAIVDWVFLQLRSAAAPGTVLATRSALLQRDGDVVDTDGQSAVTFPVGPGNYYLSVRHRNHLGVMTDIPLAMSSNPVVIDFTTPAQGNWGTNAQRLAGGSVRMLWLGDVNKDRRVAYQGPANDVSSIGSFVLTHPQNTVLAPSYAVSEYATQDVDLNGLAVYQGPGNDVTILGNTVLSAPGSTGSPSFVISEQIP